MPKNPTINNAAPVKEAPVDGNPANANPKQYITNVFPMKTGPIRSLNKEYGAEKTMGGVNPRA